MVGGQSGPVLSVVAGLKPGDSLTGQLLGRNAAGLALVALAGKQVHMPLPQNLSPGTLLTFTVQQGTNGLQFLVEPQGNQGQPAAANPAPSTATPAGQPPATTSAGLPTQPAGTGTTPASTPTPQPPPATVAARPAAPLPAPAQSAASLQAPLVNARTGLPVPAPQGAAQGQILTAQVLSAPTASTAIISLGAQELPVTLPTPSLPGAVLQLVVQAGPLGPQLAHAAPAGSIFSGTPAAPATSAGQPASAPPPALGGTAVPTTAAPQTPSQAAAASVAAQNPVVAQATLASLGNQNSIAALLNSVLRLGERARELPDEVQRVAQRLTRSALPLDAKAPDIQALQRAITRSGVFLESNLAGGASDASVEGDLKSLLITLRRALGDWLGSEAKPAVLAGKPPPPPQSGVMPRAPAAASAAPPADELAITEIGKSLLSQTDAALSRLRLHQIASLPDRSEALAATRHPIHLEVPVSLGEQQGVLHLVISRDDEGDTPEREKKTWRVQFAVNASVIGEVGAEIGLLGARTNVVLSAAEPNTAEALAETIGDLSEALQAVGLTPGVLRVRRIGAPTVPIATPPPPASGQYLDRDT